MTDNVIRPDFLTRCELDAPEMLRAIADENPSKVFVIVWPEDGGMPTYHSNTNDISVVLMRLREFEHKYFNGEFG